MSKNEAAALAACREEYCPRGLALEAVLEAHATYVLEPAAPEESEADLMVALERLARAHGPWRLMRLLLGTQVRAEAARKVAA